MHDNLAFALNTPTYDIRLVVGWDGPRDDVGIGGILQDREETVQESLDLLSVGCLSFNSLSDGGLFFLSELAWMR